MVQLIEQNIVEKGWGWEIILHNRADYCAKILRFKKGARFSMHFHMLKTETWYVNKGEFDLYYINTDTAELRVDRLVEGMIVEVEKGSPHQLVAITEGEIFEASTMHYDYDSYRIAKGDSQKC
jgi:quercetin dioxygenase-like cupin family protein